MFNIPRRTAKNFTESETNAARASGRFDAVDGIENQSRRGIFSGISRRQIALEKALAGSTSPKTLKTSTMNLMMTRCIVSQYDVAHGLVRKFAKLCKTMTPLDAIVQISESAQRLQASQNNLKAWKYSKFDPSANKAPSLGFAKMLQEISEFADKLLEKFNLFFSAAANLSNSCATTKEQHHFTGTMDTDIRSIDKNPSATPSLPVELYRLIRARASKMLPSFDFKQITAKLRDCFMRQDHQRFEYILSEASKGRSIFAKTGKFATSRKKRTIILDKDAGKLGFLATYGMAYDAQCGLIHA